MAWASRPASAEIDVLWAAFHLDVHPELLEMEQQLQSAVGHIAAADLWAGRGAELAWEFGLVGRCHDAERLDAMPETPLQNQLKQILQTRAPEPHSRG